MRVFFEAGSAGLSEEARGMLSALRLDGAAYVTVDGYSSMLSEKDMNNTLSWRRADAVRSYLSEIYGGRIVVSGKGPDWMTVSAIADTLSPEYAGTVAQAAAVQLRAAWKREDSQYGNKDIRTLDADALKELDRRVSWRLQRADITVHHAAVCCETACCEKDGGGELPAGAPCPSDSCRTDSVAGKGTAVLPDWLNADAIGRPDKIAFAPRTNLLLPLCNVGAEIPLRKHLSTALDLYYPWIGYDRTNSNCVQLMFADIEMRWWIRPKDMANCEGNTLTGHSLALGAVGGHYDFERDKKGLQGEFGGCYIDYGYTFRIARHCRLTLSLGVGYITNSDRTYTVYRDGGKLIRDDERYNRRTDWFGPVRADVSLSFPIMIKGSDR